MPAPDQPPRRRIALDEPGWSAELPRDPGPLRIVQFSRLPPERELERIGAYIAEHPQVLIRVYLGRRGTLTDLDFLRHFGGARRVAIDVFHLDSIDGLAHLSPDLVSLSLGATRRTFSMGVLSRFRALRRLAVEGHRKDIASVETLSELRSLTMRSVSLPDLGLVRALPRLRALDLKLGGTSDLSALAGLAELEYLELWMVRGLEDLGPVASLPGLRYLFLQSLRRVTALPDLSNCGALERLHLETMKGIDDLSGVKTANALRDLLLIDMPQLRWEHLSILTGHPSLRALRLGTGSVKRNREYGERLGYPDVIGLPDDLRSLRVGPLDDAALGSSAP